MLLGAQRAQMFTTDRDAFPVGRNYGKFRKIKLTARGQAVRIYGVRIVYGNGKVSRLPVYGLLSPGESTPPIDLKRDSRKIQGVYVRYRTKLNVRGSGIVELWGRP